MLIALYDVGVHVAILAHGPLPALLAVADGHLSRRMAHMMDATNSVDELVMVGASSIEAGCQFTIRTKIDNFFTHPGLEPGPRRRLRHSVHTVSVARLVSTAELHLTLMYMYMCHVCTCNSFLHSRSLFGTGRH